MTPFEYYRCYRELKVPLVNGTTLLGIDVHEYRNAWDLFHKNNTDQDKTNDVDEYDSDWDVDAAWTTARGALLRQVGKHGTSLGPNTYRVTFPLPTKENPTPAVIAEEIVNTIDFVNVFTGKGTPEQIAKTLRLAEGFGLVSPTVAAMQKYCDDYIGLDCNGFVGNYLRLKGSTKFGPLTPAYPRDFMPEGKRLTDLDDVENGSVLVWASGGHVAIIDRVSGIQNGHTSPDRYLQATVCEATAARLKPGDIHTDGLNYTIYVIYPPGKDRVFKVKRGLGGPLLNGVYIGNLL